MAKLPDHGSPLIRFNFKNEAFLFRLELIEFSLLNFCYALSVDDAVAITKGLISLIDSVKR